MKTWLKVTLGIFAFIFVLGFLGSIFNHSETNYQTGNVIDDKESTQETTKLLTILSHEMTHGEYGNMIITGIAENTANKQLSYAEIKVKFFDEEGVLIETFLDNINDLDSGEKWKFEVIYPGLDSYKVKDYSIAVGSVW